MKILVADDDPVIRIQLEATLSKFAYEVQLYSDGKEAWDALQLEDAPSLLILDWSMPGFNGIELSKKVREMQREPQPYIILLTAKSEIEDVITGLNAGADDYISKPFYPHELQARLKVGIRTITMQEELLEARNQLAIEARYDYLTGILNRRAVMKVFEKELDRSLRKKINLCVAIFDLDHFKQVNDTYGHSAGDEVLKEVTLRISSALRPYDSFGRYGGEEFLLVLPECDQGNVKTLCQRVRMLISDEPISTEAGDIDTSISIGLCLFKSEEAQSMGHLINLADEALYKAKENGRNRVETITI